MTPGEGKRRKLFEQGSIAFNRARPDSHPGYACPLCRRVAAVVDPFSLEDVPPKSIGGRPLLLTCTECNNNDGSEIDVHIAHRRDADGIASGDRAQDVKLSVGGHCITAKIRAEEKVLDIELDLSRSNPASYDEFIRELKAHFLGAEPNVSLDLSWKEKYDPWREAVAWLRVGYLYSFALLGYLYILRPELEIVRQQIKNPEKRLAPQLVKRLAGPSNDRIQFVFDPPEYRSIIVTYDDKAIILPGFEQPSTFRERILSTSELRWPSQLKGVQLPLPTRPKFLLDLDPTRIRFLSPDFAQDPASVV